LETKNIVYNFIKAKRFPQYTMKQIKELTKAEEQVMRILWQLNEAIVKDVIEQMPEPKPAYNTVSTVIRVLETKGFIDHKAYGNSYVYFPIVAEEDYKKFAFDKVMNNYFSNSYQSLVSFLVTEKNLSINELEEITKLAEKLKNDKK
jgi:BlaI family transcriptional regulator, penicillinase repressor